MLDLTLNNQTKYGAFSGSFFDKIIKVAVKEVKLNKKQIGLSVNLVGRARIQTLNKKYRSKDKATDVLSFPLADNSVLLSTIKRAKNKENAIVELGDIFICPAVAQKQAKRSGKTLKEEIIFLTVHGFLHLLGYDHEQSRAEEKKMFSIQNKILNRLTK